MTKFKLQRGVHGALVFDKESPPPSFREYNFVYGANGSGKTSLADAIERDAATQSLSVHRFDRGFVQTVLAQTDSVEGLWVIAPEAKSLVAGRDELRERLSSVESEVGVLEAQNREAERACQAFLKPMSTEMRELKRLAHGDSSSYSDRQLEKAFKALPESAEDPVDADIDDSRKALEQEPIRSISSGALDEAVSVLTALVEAAQSLDAAPTMEAQQAAWVDSAGRGVFDEGDPCPFCDYPLSSVAIERIESIEASARSADHPSYDALIRSFQKIRVGLVQTWPELVDFDHSLRNAAEDALNRCKDRGAVLVDELPKDHSAIHTLVERAEGSSDPYWLMTANEMSGVFKDLLQIVADHQRVVDDQGTVRRKAFQVYETGRLRQELGEFRALEAASSTKATELRDGRSEARRLERSLAAVDLELRGLLNPQVLNQDLARYLGHQAIRFEQQSSAEVDFGYRMVRADGIKVGRLSEGELTAIALLYFLRGLRETPQPPDVVIVDDPVTSLDDSGVFSAHSFIKDALARDHGESGPMVCITSHNHGYFRLLVDWADSLNRKDRKRAALFETLAYIDEDHQTTCRLRPMPSSLAQAGSEYAILMIRLVQRESWAGDDADPFELYIAPNIARRVLEGFLTFKFGGAKRETIGALLELAFNDPRMDGFGAQRRERLNKLLNSSAHGSSLADTYQVLTSRTEVAMVIADLLELIKSIDSDHLKGFEQ